MSVRTIASIALSTTRSLLLLLALISPCLSGQGDISGVENVPSLIGIWSIEGLEEVGGVVIALEQNGSQLYGRAKYEPESGFGWNGQVIGSISGDEIEMVIASGQDEALISSRMAAKYIKANQSLVGESIQTSNGQVLNRGGFVAIIINPNTSLYSPAIIGGAGRMDSKGVTEHIAKNEAYEGAKSQSNLTYPAKESGPNQTILNDGLADSRYHDVHLDEKSILTGICSPGPALS